MINKVFRRLRKYLIDDKWKVAGKNKNGEILIKDDKKEILFIPYLFGAEHSWSRKVIETVARVQGTTKEELVEKMTEKGNAGK